MRNYTAKLEYIGQHTHTNVTENMDMFWQSTETMQLHFAGLLRYVYDWTLWRAV